MHKPQWTEAKDCRVKVDDRRYMCVNHFDCVIMCVCFRRTGPVSLSGTLRVCRLLVSASRGKRLCAGPAGVCACAFLPRGP